MKPITRHIASHDLGWRYEPAPAGKCLLLNMDYVAYFGPATGEFMQEYIAWCPLPKRDRHAERKLLQEHKKMNETFIVRIAEDETDSDNTEPDFLDGIEPQQCSIDDQECEACQ